MHKYTRLKLFFLINLIFFCLPVLVISQQVTIVCTVIPGPCSSTVSNPNPNPNPNPDPNPNPNPNPNPIPPQELGLIQETNLKWIGAFTGPTWTDDMHSLYYAGRALAYNPANNSLFITGHEWYNQITEISIPNTLGTDLNQPLPQATYLQPFADPTNGKRFGDTLGGALVYNNRLITNTRLSYDGAHLQNQSGLSHYATSLDLTNISNAIGPVPVNVPKVNYISGSMTVVPDVWNQLIGKALSGWCCGPSIISRTSEGPAFASFDPDDIGTVSPVTFTPLVYYPLEHPTIGYWGFAPGPWPPAKGEAENHLYNGTAVIDGLSFPNDFRSVLAIGSNGYGAFCYGDMTGDFDKVWTRGTVDQNGGYLYCIYRPGYPDGGHGYYSVDVDTKGLAPYYPQVWAYDANDLMKVKNGLKQPWEIVPYAYWTLKEPKGHNIKGVATDLIHNKIYVFEQAVDYGAPVIHVYQVVK